MSKSVPFATTIHVRDHCLCLATQRAARALARHFDDALRPLGITSGQFSLMMALNRPEPPTVGMVADVLAMDRTTVTAALKPLERRGLVAVAADAADRRARRPALTAAGESLLAEAVVIWTERHAAVDRVAGENLAAGLAGLVAGLRPGASATDEGA